MSRLTALVIVLCIAVTAAFAIASATLPSGARSGSDAPAMFERKVRAYLLSNPEVIMEAVATLQRRKEADRIQQQRAAARADRAALHDSGIVPVAGNPEGDVTVVEFFDYRCPYCRRAYQEVKALMASDPKVRVIYREFPVLGPDSVYASRAAVASVFQGKYLAFHDALMTYAGRLDPDAVMEMARKVGLDRARLEADMNKPAVGAVIAEGHALAKRLGINATPTFVIGDALVPGYMDADTLDSFVQKARGGG